MIPLILGEVTLSTRLYRRGSKEYPSDWGGGTYLRTPTYMMGTTLIPLFIGGVVISTPVFCGGTNSYPSL